MLSAIIIDDQEISRIYLHNLVKENCKNVEVLAMADDVQSGKEIIESCFPDIVFLDVELTKGSGFEIIEEVGEQDFEIIFTTGYEKYALQAIKASAIDYLKKPVDRDELKAAVDKAEKRVREKKQYQTSRELKENHEDRNISIPTAHGLEYLKVSDILHCESDHYYTYIYLVSGKKHLVAKTLKDFEKILSPFNFVRVHQSHLINLDHLRKFIKSDSQVVLSDKSRIPVSRRKKELLLQKIS